MTIHELEYELSKIIEASKVFGADRAILYGSCLEDVESARDIDIAVEGISPNEFFNYYGKVDMATDDVIDIIDLADARNHLRNKILIEGRILYEKSA